MDRFIRFRGGWRAFAVGMNRRKVGFVPLKKHLFLAVFVATGASPKPTNLFDAPGTVQPRVEPKLPTRGARSPEAKAHEARRRRSPRSAAGDEQATRSPGQTAEPQRAGPRVRAEAEGPLAVRGGLAEATRPPSQRARASAPPASAGAGRMGPRRRARSGQKTGPQAERSPGDRRSVVGQRRSGSRRHRRCGLRRCRHRQHKIL